MNTTGKTDRPVSLADEEALDDLLAERETVLLELYTDGCGICASMEPVLTNLVRTSDAVVATVNPRDDPPLIERFDVQSVPKFVLFVDGEVVAERADGFVPAEELAEWVEAAAN